MVNVKTKKFLANRKFAIPIILVAAIVVLLGLELTNTTHILHKSKTVSGTIPSKPAVTSSNKAKNNSPKTVAQSGGTVSNDKAGTAISDANAPLAAPFGTFVSNHKPSLSGSESPSQEESVCNTTPGATCTITFTNGNIKKSLAPRTADSRGAAYWTWDVNEAGFSVGSWEIIATATLKGDSKSSTDNLHLEVQR
jgi:hypothetical protein